MTLEDGDDGLYAECVTGSRVQLTNVSCPISSQLTLLEEIHHAGADDSRPVVITPVWEHNSLVWHREFADTLADHLNENQVDEAAQYSSLQTLPYPRSGRYHG
jgi:hypothetical protein